MTQTATPDRRAARVSLHRITWLAMAALVSISAPAGSQPRSQLIRERLKTRPDDPTLYYYLAGAEFTEGHKAAGLEALDRLASLGNGFLPVREMGFDSVWSDSAFRQSLGRLEGKLPKVTEARELFRLDRTLIPEGIAWDPKSGSYFVGSIAQRKVVRVDSSGAVSDFSKPGDLRNVLGLAVDPSRRRLHAVSTSLVAGASDRARNQVVTYDLDTGALVRRVDVPAAAQLNDVAVSPDGELFVTDSGAGGVYRVRSTGTVDTLVAPGSVPGVNGIARSSDGTALYLAHATGVARFDLTSREILPRIETPKGETIAAIDGLYADGSTLLGVQNVTNPGRVVASTCARTAVASNASRRSSPITTPLSTSRPPARSSGARSRSSPPRRYDSTVPTAASPRRRL